MIKAQYVFDKMPESKWILQSGKVSFPDTRIYLGGGQDFRFDHVELLPVEAYYTWLVFNDNHVAKLCSLGSTDVLSAQRTRSQQKGQLCACNYTLHCLWLHPRSCQAHKRQEFLFKLSCSSVRCPIYSFIYLWNLHTAVHSEYQNTVSQIIQSSSINEEWIPGRPWLTRPWAKSPLTCATQAFKYLCEEEDPLSPGRTQLLAVCCQQDLHSRTGCPEKRDQSLPLFAILVIWTGPVHRVASFHSEETHLYWWPTCQFPQCTDHARDLGQVPYLELF